MRLAVFASGRGSNMLAIANAIEEGRLPGVSILDVWTWRREPLSITTTCYDFDDSRVANITSLEYKTDFFFEKAKSGR